MILHFAGSHMMQLESTDVALLLVVAAAAAPAANAACMLLLLLLLLLACRIERHLKICMLLQCAEGELLINASDVGYPAA